MPCDPFIGYIDGPVHHCDAIVLDREVAFSVAGRLGGAAVDRALEYHRTRVHLGMTPATLDPELARLAEVVKRELAAIDEEAEQSCYSKLTFLRQQQRAGRGLRRPVLHVGLPPS